MPGRLTRALSSIVPYHHIQRLKRWAIGDDPRRLPRRAAVATVAVLVAITVIGLWYWLTRDIDPQTTSLRYLRPVLQIVTSSWFPVVILLVIAWRSIRIRRDRYADVAEQYTGYAKRSVLRLAAEARNPGGVRVVATDADSRQEIEDRIRERLETGEDDQLSINPEAFTSIEEGE